MLRFAWLSFTEKPSELDGRFLRWEPFAKFIKTAQMNRLTSSSTFSSFAQTLLAYRILFALDSDCNASLGMVCFEMLTANQNYAFAP